MFVCLGVFVVTLISNSLCLKDIPEGITKCHRNDPKIDDCLLQAAEDARTSFRKGVSNLSLPPLTSYHVPKIVVDQEMPEANISAVMFENTVTGIDTYHFKKLQFDPKALTLSGVLTFDFINLAGNYTTKSKIIGVPVEGTGRYGANSTGIDVSFVQVSRLVKKHDKDYLKFVSLDSDLQLTNLALNYTGLFEGLPRLAKAADAAIQQFNPQIIQIAVPIIKKITSEIMEKEMLKKLFQVPYDKLFPL